MREREHTDRSFERRAHYTANTRGFQMLKLSRFMICALREGALASFAIEYLLHYLL